MAGTAVRTAFLSSIAALNLRLFLTTALLRSTTGIAVATLYAVFTTAALIATAFIAAATAAHRTAFAVYCSTRLLALRAYKDTALTLAAVIAIAAVAVVAVALLTAVIAVLVLAAVVTITAVAVVAVTLLTIVVIAAALVITAAIIVIALTIFRTALLAIIITLILMVLLHIPLSVITKFFVVILLRLLLSRCCRLHITFFSLSRFWRLRLFIISFVNNSHNTIIGNIQIAFVNVIFLQQFNYFMYRLANLLGNLIDSFTTHVSTSSSESSTLK